MAKVTIDDLAAMIANQFSEQNKNLDKRFNGIESDITEIKQDVGVLKDDVKILKQDVGTLKDDVSGLRQDVEKLKDGQEDIFIKLELMKHSDMQSMEKRVGKLETDVKVLKAVKC